MTITTSYTRKEAGRKIAELIKNYYLGNSMDQTIGMTADGELDYQYDVHGGDVEVSFYKTEGGFSLGEGDPEDEAWWTEEILDSIGELLVSDWEPVEANGSPIDIEYAV
jgi:hypothetical protein